MSQNEIWNSIQMITKKARNTFWVYLIVFFVLFLVNQLYLFCWVGHIKWIVQCNFNSLCFSMNVRLTIPWTSWWSTSRVFWTSSTGNHVWTGGTFSYCTWRRVTWAVWRRKNSWSCRLSRSVVVCCSPWSRVTRSPVKLVILKLS